MSLLDQRAIGFVILSHEGPAKLSRLVTAIRREYPHAPIAVHHDFSQHHIDRATIGHEVQWVEDWCRTGWAKWQVVEGALRGFRLLYMNNRLKWFFLLSASDYPIRKGVDVAAELSATDCDAFVDARPLVDGTSSVATFTGSPNPKLDRFDASATRALKRRFYLSPQLWVPIVRTRPRLRAGKLTWRPPIEGPHPFRNGLACFYGDHWFTGNRRAVSALLDPNPTNLRLERHFRARTQSDESYYQTVLANTPGLLICRDNRRFAEWSGGTSGPIDLTSGNLEEAMASGAFFARKFEANAPVLDEIDAILRR